MQTLYILRVGSSIHFASLDRKECIRQYQTFTREIQNISTIYTVELTYDFSTLEITGKFVR